VRTYIVAESLTSRVTCQTSLVTPTAKPPASSVGFYNKDFVHVVSW